MYEVIAGTVEPEERGGGNTAGPAGREGNHGREIKVSFRVFLLFLVNPLPQHTVPL
jgi:hypothetical protein